jgi:ribosomal protein S12 methylthiotransferase accessory factor
MAKGIELKDVRKQYTLDQDKVRGPKETVAWVLDRFDRLEQPILEGVRRIDSGRLNIPVFVSRCAPGATLYTGTPKQMGKGATPEQAKASALMELAERFSFFHFLKTSDFQRMRAADLTGPIMPLVELCQAVHHPVADWERAEKFLAEVPLAWTEATCLTTGQTELIPLSWFYAINEFNGPAAGNCLEEAVLQALCEVIERHVSALTWRERLSTPEIDPDSIDDPVAVELLGKFAAQGVQVKVLDYSLKTGVPSVGAIAWDPATFPQESEIVYTSGTATSPAKALIRALTEIAQLAGDFNRKTEYVVSALPKFKSLAEADYVLQTTGRVALPDLPDISDDNLRLEIERGVTALSRLGLNVYVVDVTHPVLDVPAVYVIIPGAHFSDRTFDTSVPYHAGRLLVQGDGAAGAAELLGELQAAYPDTVYLPFFEGLSLMARGEYEAALNRLDLAESRLPADDELTAILVQRAICLREMERYKDAVDVLARAKGLDPSQKEIFQQEGVCLFKLGYYEAAIESFARAIQIDHGSAIDYANIGVNLARLGRLDEARQMLESALELDPGLDFARERLAELGT